MITKIMDSLRLLIWLGVMLWCLMGLLFVVNAAYQVKQLLPNSSQPIIVYVLCYGVWCVIGSELGIGLTKFSEVIEAVLTHCVGFLTKED